MRNLKKFFAVVLVVAIMLTSMATAFAATTPNGTAEAANLKELGLYDGEGYKLTDSIVRFEAMYMLGNILGIGEAAEATYPTVADADKVLAAKFSDANQVPDWAKAVIAYEVELEMVQGGDGLLNPKGSINAAGFATIIARNVLDDGTIEPEDALAALADAGAFTAAQVAQFATNTNLTRGVLAQVAYSALKAKDADGVSVIEKLVAAGIVDEEIALDQELIVPVTIESVAAVADQTITVGQTPVLPAEVEATYSNGDKANVAVEWADVDTTTAGTKEVKGTIEGYEDGITAKVIVNNLTLAVESVTANNLKEIVVTFNAAVDKTSAETAANYYLNSITPGTLTPKLQADGKTVVITVGATTTSSLANQGDYKLTIEKVKNSAGVAIVKTVEDFTAFDAVLPTVTGITVTGPKTFVVTFSEPVTSGTTGSVAVKSANTTLAVSTATANNTNKVSVTLYTELTTGVDYTVTVKDYADYAGYKNVIKTETLAYAKDNNVPVVSLDSANQQYVVVKFDKPVTGLAKENFYHTFSAWAPIGIYPTLADMNAGTNAITTGTTNVTTVYVKFATTGLANEHPLQAGTVSIHVLANANSTDVKDNWGNKLADTTLTATITSDTTVPEVTAVEASAKNAIKVTFSKATSNAGTNSNYEVLNSDGSKIDGLTFTTTVAGDKKSVVLNLNKDLTGKSIVVNVKDVKDDTLNLNKMSNYTTTIAFSDKEFLGVDRVEFDATAKVLYVVYKEAMNDTAINLANYKLLDGVTVRSFSGSAAFFGGNKVVKIDLSVAEAGYVTTNADSLLIANVQDLSGNGPSAFQISQQIIALGSPAATPGLDVAANLPIKAIDKNTVTVQFNQELVAINPAEFELSITVGTTNVYVTPTALATVNNSTGTLVTLTFGTVDIPANVPATVALRSNFGGTPVTKNIFGVAPAAIAATQPADKIVPAIAKVATTTINDIAMIDTLSDGTIDAVAITYNEVLDATKISTLSYGVVGRTISKAYLNNAAAIAAVPGYGVNNNVVILELTSVTTPATGALKVVQKLDIYDAVGNKLAASTDELSAVDNIAPRATVAATTGATNNGTTLTITFSEAIYNGATALYNGQDVKSLFTYSGTATNYVSATYDASNNSVVFAFTSAENAATLTAAATLQDAKTNLLVGSTDVATYTAATTLWTLN